jgi:predicted anti-sigma-YlaC factor YlaD
LSYTDLLNSFGGDPNPSACVQRHLALCPKCTGVRRIIQELIRDEVTAQESRILSCVKLPALYQTLPFSTN